MTQKTQKLETNQSLELRNFKQYLEILLYTPDAAARYKRLAQNPLYTARPITARAK